MEPKAAKAISLLKFTTSFVVLLNLCSVTHAQQACWNPEVIQRKEIPACAANSIMSFPDASKPTAAVFLSYIVSRNDETLVAAYNLIKIHAPDTKLNILVSKQYSNFAKYASYCERGITEANKYLCQLKDILNDKSVVNVIQLAKNDEQVFPQDYLQFGVKGNAPALFPTVNPFETMDYVNPDGSPFPKTFIQDDVANVCKFENLKLSISRLKGAASTMGGNIESLPGGATILGEDFERRSALDALDGMKDSDLFSMFRKAFPSSAPDAQIQSSIQELRSARETQNSQESLLNSDFKELMKINTAVAPVGHADEMFSIVKSNNSCGYSVLVPSPALALKLLKASSVTEVKSNCISKVFNGRPTFDGASPADLVNHSKSGCIGFRGQTFSEFLSQPDVIKINARLEEVSEQNITAIEKYLARKGCSSADIIRLPYLVTVTAQAASEGVVPNPVNALIISPISGAPSLYLNNPTYVQSFDSYIASQLTSRGLTISLVNSSDYFSGQGGLHCGSSTLQLCRQK